MKGQNSQVVIVFTVVLIVAAFSDFASAPATDESESSPSATAASQSMGCVEGLVTYSGPIPKPIPVPEAQTVRQLVVVDPKSKGLKDAVVWLERASPPAVDTNRARKPAIMDQVEFFFVPHVLAIRAGQPVEFRNSDAANHGVTAKSLRQENCFNIVTPPSGSYTHTFSADSRPVAIGCPIHSGMGAWIWVFEHPYYATTDAKGRFRIADVPPGKHTLVVRHVEANFTHKHKLEVEPKKTTRVIVSH
jgi:plastocyanin